ncbi:MAG: alpha/beta hydrolase [Deltaproteobacteria bacterium]|nr:alpha/beta hydrolase [Deltaproteobacteria bacterium]
MMAGGAAAYLTLTLVMTYGVHRVPRRPVHEPPDWGRVTDARIPAADGGSLEVWRVEPEGPSRGTVLLAHGWSRNRDRMVGRARLFGSLGYTTLIHSARDHGGSSPYRFMNAFRFAEDIESVMARAGGPVLLYGHSAGAAGAVIAAHRNPRAVRMLFLEGCYARTRKALVSLYGQHIPVLGKVLAPGIVAWMHLFYLGGMDRVDPVRLAPDLDLPVLLIQGERDAAFTVDCARDLRDAFPAGRAELFVAPGSDHSSSSLTPEYPVAARAFLGRHDPQETEERGKR